MSRGCEFCSPVRVDSRGQPCGRPRTGCATRRKGLRYESDLTDEEYVLIEPFPPPERRVSPLSRQWNNAFSPLLVDAFWHCHYSPWSDVFRDCCSKERPQLQAEAALDRVPQGGPWRPCWRIEVLGRRGGARLATSLAPVSLDGGVRPDRRVGLLHHFIQCVFNSPPTYWHAPTLKCCKRSEDKARTRPA